MRKLLQEGGGVADSYPHVCPWRRSFTIFEQITKPQREDTRYYFISIRVNVY